MDTPINQINFAFHRIATLQFAILDEEVPKNPEFLLNTAISFGLGAIERIVGVKGTFQFETQSKVFLKLELCCEFVIDQAAWDAFTDNESQIIVFPKGLMTHLTTLLVGTGRGILHTKTENSPFNRFILPAINVTELVTQDIEMDLLAQPTAQ